jgi:hypothetical protein
VLEDQQTVCHACGAEWQEYSSTGVSVSKVSRLKPSSPIPERKLTSANRSLNIRENTHKISRRVQPGLSFSSLKGRESWHGLLSFVPLGGLVVFASYLLSQYTVHTKVQTFFLDDKYYELILAALRAHLTDYYSIAVNLYHQLYAPTIAMIPFPLILYVWLLAPSIADLKWLYFGFAMAASIASYFTIATITKQRLLAALSAAWIAYFLETNVYLMFEYWAVTVFLIGLAFFVSERHVPAAVTIGVATLIKEVFAPFMLIASIYYVSQLILLKRKKDIALTLSSLQKRQAQILINKKLAAWCIATVVVGVAYFLNGLASGGAGEPIHFFVTFDPSILPLLFAGSWFRYPPMPLVLVVGLALIGMSAFASRDQRMIAYGSFAFMILLMLTAGGGGLITSWQAITQSSPRYVAMSIALVNLFWLVGLYKIAAYPMRRFSSLLRSHRLLAVD